VVWSSFVPAVHNIVAVQSGCILWLHIAAVHCVAVQCIVAVRCGSTCVGMVQLSRLCVCSADAGVVMVCRQDVLAMQAGPMPSWLSSESCGSTCIRRSSVHRGSTTLVVCTLWQYVDLRPLVSVHCGSHVSIVAVRVSLSWCIVAVHVSLSWCIVAVHVSLSCALWQYMFPSSASWQYMFPSSAHCDGTSFFRRLYVAATCLQSPAGGDTDCSLQASIITNSRQASATLQLHNPASMLYRHCMYICMAAVICFELGRTM
jgi:hypothetical protein